MSRIKLLGGGGGGVQNRTLIQTQLWGRTMRPNMTWSTYHVQYHERLGGGPIIILHEWIRI